MRKISGTATGTGVLLWAAFSFLFIVNTACAEQSGADRFLLPDIELVFPEREEKPGVAVAPFSGDDPVLAAELADVLLAALSLSGRHPDAMISGQPIFGADAPLSRLRGRELTNFWIHIETLSRYIPDAMCGYRVYPLLDTVGIIDRSYLGRRMDFDIEYLVRAAGLKLVSLTSYHEPSDKYTVYGFARVV